MKLKFTITFEFPFSSEELPNYEATTVEEAAANQQRWCEDGTCYLPDLIQGANDIVVKVEAVI